MGLMKKLSLYIFLVLMFSLFTSHSFAEKYAVENIDKFKMNKDNELDCNIVNENDSRIKYFGEVNKSDNIGIVCGPTEQK